MTSLNTNSGERPPLNARRPRSLSVLPKTWIGATPFYVSGLKARKSFDGEALLLNALNLADASGLGRGVDGLKWLRRESNRLGCPQELKAHTRRVSNLPVEFNSELRGPRLNPGAKGQRIDATPRLCGVEGMPYLGSIPGAPANDAANSSASPGAVSGVSCHVNGGERGTVLGLANRGSIPVSKLALRGVKPAQSFLLNPMALQRRLGGLSECFHTSVPHDVKIITHGVFNVVPFPRKAFP